MPSDAFEPPPPPAWSGAPILVVGDLMLDTYMRGAATRISPEAPVPILHVGEETDVPGGAANVAANIASLGGRPILCGVIGSDEAAAILTSHAAALGIDCSPILNLPSRPTTRKTRLMGGRQQLLRVDREHSLPLEEKETAELIRRIRGLAASVKAIVVSDYAKGVVSRALIDALRQEARAASIPLVVDPKPANASWFKDVTVLTPNAAEAAQMCARLSLAVAQQEVPGQGGGHGAALCKHLGASVLVTLGEQGMALFEEGRPMLGLATRAREVYDVAGAGDTVAAALTLGMASGLPLPESARIANAAAGLVVEKVGTATVSFAELFGEEQ